MLVVDTPMMAVENYSKTYVSCSRNETGSIVKTIELNGTTSVNMPLMEAMNHNRMCVPSSINGVDKSVEKQDIQGTIVGIEMMATENHVKPSVVQISKRQEKKRKVQDGHKTTLYAEWWKNMWWFRHFLRIVVIELMNEEKQVQKYGFFYQSLMYIKTTEMTNIIFYLTSIKISSSTRISKFPIRHA